ncbi:hypothetical protein FEM48_Zijuj10G0012700 [Ziziphus jujuba var. spinosa]|uniref:C2 domain-containing protein n=1 Tax=Ziziphus jujuba var. spinosa TaxID=714518 RepID=A0A978UKF4_ZIZJJ|nr:hypothetical protein FEM48_Zijuj10G0012700 [Ziziphus jujuba var. spinosa]
MILQSASSASFHSSIVLPQFRCPCGDSNSVTSPRRTQNFVSVSCSKRRKRLQIASFSHRNFRWKWGFQVRAISSDGTKPLNIELVKSASRGAKSFVAKQFTKELEGEELAEESSSPIQLAIPVLSMFLTKLLTQDLPRLFVRPKKIVLDFQKGKAVGPVPNDLKPGDMQEGNKDFVGELSVTIVDARKLSYFFYGKTDPYVVLSLGDQVIRSKKNSQTTVIGPPGEPIWNQDFHMLVANPRKQKLSVQVKDSLGFTDLTIGTGEVDLGSLQDTVPTDKIVVLQRGWGLFRKSSYGEILLRLTYKAYVEDEEDDKAEAESTDIDALDSDDDLPDSYVKEETEYSKEADKESFMDVLAALIVSEEFRGIVASETGTTKIFDNVSRVESRISRSLGLNDESAPQDSNNSSERSQGSALFWLAVITSISVLIAINIGGSSLFNP